MTEWVVLATNSAPSIQLRNTCAGVHQMGIFSLPVRALESAGKEVGRKERFGRERVGREGVEDHLGLWFGDLDERMVRTGRVKGYEHEVGREHDGPCRCRRPVCSNSG